MILKDPSMRTVICQLCALGKLTNEPNCSAIVAANLTTDVDFDIERLFTENSSQVYSMFHNVTKKWLVIIVEII